jgi:hypothetical protein
VSRLVCLASLLALRPERGAAGALRRGRPVWRQFVSKQARLAAVPRDVVLARLKTLSRAAIRLAANARSL